MRHESLIHVYVTPQDIQAFENGLCVDPIEHALQRLTGNSWNIFEHGYVREAAMPFRAGFLPEVIQSLRQWIHLNGSAHSFEFDFEIHPSESKPLTLSVFQSGTAHFDADLFALAKPLLEEMAAPNATEISRRRAL